MTKKKILIATLLFIFAISSCCFATDDVITTDGSDQQVVMSAEDLASALEGVTSTEEPAPQSNENWVNGDLYVVNDKVKVEGVVDGNVFAMGQEVTVTAEIGGDLFVMAEKVTLDGAYVYSSTFVMANEVVINGITYDLYAMCNSLKLDSNGYVYRDLRAMGNEINLAGRVRRNAFIESNSIKFDESVGTIIYGNLEYSSDESEFKAPEGVVAGEVKYTQDAGTKIDIDTDAVAKVSVWSIVWKHLQELISTLITTLIVTLLLAFLAPKFLEKLASMKVGKAFGSLGVGVLAPFALGLACIILFIVAIILQVAGLGIAVCGTAIFAFITLSSIATAIASVYFGKLIAKAIKKDGKLFLILFSLLVAVAIWVVGLIPLLGGLVSLLAWLFGVGAVILNMLPCKKAKAE